MQLCKTYRKPFVSGVLLPTSSADFDIALQRGNILFSHLTPHSLAWQAGLRLGDIVIAVDDILVAGPLASIQQVQDALSFARNNANVQGRGYIRLALHNGSVGKVVTKATSKTRKVNATRSYEGQRNSNVNALQS